MRTPSKRVLGELQSFQCVEVGGDCLAGRPGLTVTGDIRGDLGELGRLADVSTKRDECSPKPVGCSSGPARLGSANLHVTLFEVADSGAECVRPTYSACVAEAASALTTNVRAGVSGSEWVFPHV